MPHCSSVVAIVAIFLSQSNGGSSFRLSHFPAASLKRHQKLPMPSVASLGNPVSYTGKLQSSSPMALFVSSSSASSSSTARSGGKSQIVFQKVIKPPGAAADNPLLLGKLVEFLQAHFELPEKLPMVYEAVEPRTDIEDDRGVVASWDSPLSPSPQATRLDLEVVAIYSDDNNGSSQQTSLPSMAMVVVRKAEKTSHLSPMAPMMHDLFADSERRILRALDRGLEDFLMGKVELASDETPTTNNEMLSMHEAQDAMIEEILEDSVVEEMLEEAAVNHPSVANNDGNNIAIDVDFSKVEPESKQDVDATNEKKVGTKTQKSPTITNGENDADFAVQAAKKMAERTKSKSPPFDKKSPKEGVVEDFAVAAARKAAEMNKSKRQQKRARLVDEEPQSKPGVQKKVPSVVGSSSPRAFRTVVSTPEMFLKRQKELKASKAKRGQPAKAPGIAANVRVSTASVEAKVDKDTPKESNVKRQKQRRLNLNVVDLTEEEEEEAELDPKKQPTAPATKINSTAVEKSATNNRDAQTSSDTPPAMPTDQEIAKTAQAVMEQMADQGEDLSAEEMLKKVMKFGKEQDQQNVAGSGFVSGAFEKAKELLREQKRQRDERLQNKIADQISNEFELTPETNVQPEGKNKDNRQFKGKPRGRSKEEEELRRFFEAGERLADGRISLATAPEVVPPPGMTPRNPTPEEDKLVDDLIAGDKSVSSHARILDDELAELEVRINKSPGEELDAPSIQKNPLFDVFSGPETYNPNVDPETAVNWPGALPGTKAFKGKNRLPKELDEAIKQAKFAADVLRKLEEKEVVVHGETKKQFFVGKRDMSKQQVDNLRAVVNEASEIGIIQDPLILMAERSRLQMVLDELWTQPEDRVRDVVSNYKDLLLSDSFVSLVKERLQDMADRDLEALRQNSREEEETEQDHLRESRHQRERDILGQLVAYAQLLLKETRALGAELEAQQLEVIRSICKVAMDPSHTTDEEAAIALSDAVRDMRPLFDDMFVAYLKYAVAEEEGRLAREGVLDDPEHNQWLFVLQIVQQGVYTEIAKSINRYIEHIWYVLRMETPTERRMLLAKLIDAMPTLDVRPFVQVVDNIVGSLGEAAKGEFSGATELGEMTNKLLQLHRDMKELLPPDRIDEMSRDADDWAAKQKKKLLEQRKLTKQRLKAAGDTEEYDQEIENLMGRRGEMDRFD